jgi:hypothetical protein
MKRQFSSLALGGLIVAATTWMAHAGAIAAEATADAPDCRQALQALRAEEDSAAANRGSDARRAPPAVVEAQRKAAVACLGPAALTAPARSGLVQPATHVPSAARVSAAPKRPAAGTLPAAAAVLPQARPTITTCDALGCWASDGSRLMRNGPTLLGPRGACTAQGAALNCP